MIKWNYLALFAGIGGFRRGLDEAGFSFNWTSFSEIDKYAKKVYKTHFRDSKDLGNVKKIKTEYLPKNGKSILTGGFPCQDLSISGKQKGLQGHRSGLFFELVRILSEWQPDIFIIENVKGLLIINKGKDFETVIKELADLRIYHIEWQLLNSKQFVPQNRERIFIVGRHIRNGCPRAIFPFGKQSKETHNKRIALSKLIGGIPKANKSTEFNQSSFIYDIKYIAPTLTTDPFLIKVSESQFKYSLIRLKRSKSTMTELYKSIKYGKNRTIRYITPTECERLQGFPDGWTDVGIADVHRYRLLGNTVSVPIVREIGKKLLEVMNIK